MRDNEVCFRVRGIPHAFDKAETEKHVRRALSLGADVKIRIRSLAPEPYPLGEQIATVDFDARPERLSRDNFMDEWNVFCDCGTCTANDSGCEFTIDSHFRDITVLHWPKNEEWEMDVIAIPGLGGHAFGSFKSRGSTEMWLRDYIPRQLPGARVFTYGYDSHLVGSESFQSVRDLAVKFRKIIERIRRHPQKFDMRKPIVFIGHSFGGIVLKEAILRMADAEVQDMNIFGSITGILFFGVPNHGMEIKSLLPMVHAQPNEDLVRSLRQDSDLLISQSERFSEQFKGEREGVDFNKIKIFSFYETKTSPTAQMVRIHIPMGSGKMDGPPTVLVGKSSATHGRPWETNENFVRPIDKAHSELVKFASRHDEDYREVLYLLRDLTSEKGNLPPYRLSKIEKECLRSLAFTEQDSRLQAILTTEDTCTWFAKHPSYKRWLNLDNQTTLLSIVGHPGVGKSTLMKYAFNHTKEQFDGKAIVLSHFFDGKTKESSISTGSIFPNFAFLRKNSKGDPNLTRSCFGLYRNLLNQILSAQPTLLSHRCPESILSVFEKKQSTRGKAWEDWKWQEEELREFLKAILTEAVLAAPVFVFIDALDECDSAKGIAKYFSDLCTTTLGLHLCVSYRKHLDAMPVNVANLQICVEEEDGQEIAIREVVEHILREIQDDEKRTKVQMVIINGAKRIFLWAILVCTQAVEMADAGDNTTNIEEMVRTVPPELDNLFKSLLVKIPKNKREQSIKLLQWVCYATRPLSIEELQFALAIDADSEAMSVEQLKTNSDFRADLDDVIRAVRTTSQGLADIRHSYGKITVQLIHHTVHEYLDKSGFNLLESLNCTDMTARARILESTAAYRGHAQLARACIKCIQMPIVDSLGTLPTVRLFKGYAKKEISSSRDPSLPYQILEVKFSEAQDWVDVREYLPLFLYALSSVNRHMAAGGVKENGTTGIFSRALRYLGKPGVMTSWNRMLELACDRPPISVSFPSSSKPLSLGIWWKGYRTYLDTITIHRPWRMMVQPDLFSSRITVQCIYQHLPLWRVYKFTETTSQNLAEEESSTRFVILMPHPLLWVPYITAVLASQRLAQLVRPMATYSRFENLVIKGLFLIVFHIVIASLPLIRASLWTVFGFWWCLWVISTSIEWVIHVVGLDDIFTRIAPLIKLWFMWYLIKVGPNLIRAR